MDNDCSKKNFFFLDYWSSSFDLGRQKKQEQKIIIITLNYYGWADIKAKPEITPPFVE